MPSETDTSGRTPAEDTTDSAGRCSRFAQRQSPPWVTPFATAAENGTYSWFVRLDEALFSVWKWTASRTSL
jgi:hypothetical protein